MTFNPPLDIGNILTGQKPYVYEIGKQYDWTYRLCSIKALADYSAFYHMCPLQGPVFAGKSLEEAVAYIDAQHASEQEDSDDENLYHFPF